MIFATATSRTSYYGLGELVTQEFALMTHPPYLALSAVPNLSVYILSFLDAKSLSQAELVCKKWYTVISDGQLWKKLIQRQVRVDPLWRGLAERRGW